jgi:hypothetical protein
MKRVNKGLNGVVNETSSADSEKTDDSPAQDARAVRRQYTRPTVQKRRSLRYATLFCGGGSGGSAPSVN